MNEPRVLTPDEINEIVVDGLLSLLNTACPSHPMKKVKPKASPSYPMKKDEAKLGDCRL